MSLHSIDLHHVHYQNVVDEWKILFLDNELNPFNEDKPLEKWDVSNVKDMDEMFEEAESMKKLPSWYKES